MSESAEKSPLKIRCPNCQRRLDVSLLVPFSVFACPDCGFQVTVPKWWGDYLLEGLVSGDDGVESYRALEPSLDREVMVELVRDRGETASESQERYLDCIRRLSSVADPSLSVVYGCGHCAEGVYSVVQYLPEGLDNVGRQDWSEVISWLRPVLVGLSKAAGESVYHGRLDLSCLRRTESGKVCVTGFGVGMALEGRISGDGYASPERESGDGASLVSDIYSLGKVIWRCLSGDLPEHGGVLGDEVPAHVVTLLGEMTALSPFDRPQSYEEILSRLEELRGESQGQHKKVIHRGGHGPEGKSLAGPGALRGVQGSGGGSGGMVLLVCLLLGIAGSLCYLLFRGEEVGASVAEVSMKASAVETGAVAGEVTSERAVKARPERQPEGQRDTAELPFGGQAKDDVRSSLQVDWRPLPASWRRRRPRMKSPRLNVSRKVLAFAAKVPAECRPGVEAQIRIVSQALELLRQYTSKTGFDRGARSRLILCRDSRELPVRIRMGNRKGLWLEAVRKTSEPLPERIRLEDLHWISYVELLDYYGRFSYERLQELRKGTPEYVSAREALVRHYLVLTLLCDWYGEDSVARKHGRRCVKLEPKTEKLLEKFGISVR